MSNFQLTTSLQPGGNRTAGFAAIVPSSQASKSADDRTKIKQRLCASYQDVFTNMSELCIPEDGPTRKTIAHLLNCLKDPEELRADLKDFSARLASTASKFAQTCLATELSELANNPNNFEFECFREAQIMVNNMQYGKLNHPNLSKSFEDQAANNWWETSHNKRKRTTMESDCSFSWIDSSELPGKTLEIRNDGHKKQKTTFFTSLIEDVAAFVTSEMAFDKPHTMGSTKLCIKESDTSRRYIVIDFQHSAPSTPCLLPFDPKVPFLPALLPSFELYNSQYSSSFRSMITRAKESITQIPLQFPKSEEKNDHLHLVTIKHLLMKIKEFLIKNKEEDGEDERPIISLSLPLTTAQLLEKRQQQQKTDTKPQTPNEKSREQECLAQLQAEMRKKLLEEEKKVPAAPLEAKPEETKPERESHPQLQLTSLQPQHHIQQQHPVHQPPAQAQQAQLHLKPFQPHGQLADHQQTQIPQPQQEQQKLVSDVQMQLQQQQQLHQHLQQKHLQQQLQQQQQGLDQQQLLQQQIQQQQLQQQQLQQFQQQQMLLNQGMQATTPIQLGAMGFGAGLQNTGTGLTTSQMTGLTGNPMFGMNIGMMPGGIPFRSHF